MAKVMKLPRAVEEANRRADEILAEQNKSEATVEDAAPEVVDNTSSEPIVLKEDIQVKPESTEVDSRDTKGPEYYEHRLKTIQGMWDADKRRASQEKDAIREQYESRLQALEEKLKKAPTVPEAFDIRNYFDDSEIEQYGNDLPKVMLRMAAKISKEAAERAVDHKLETELQPVRREVEKSRENAQERETQNFWSAFTAQVPNWQDINNDAKFHAWLSEVEPLYGRTRQSLLTEAEQTLNVSRVVAVFKSFGNELQKNQAAISSRVARKEIPDSLSSQPSTQVDSSPVFTASQIRKHYDDLSRGLYKNKMDKWVELERRIDQAYANGRVSPG